MSADDSPGRRDAEVTFRRRTLIVTNDFPPRQGGIQSYVWELAVRQPPGSVVVYASDHEGSREFDAAAPFPVVRHPTGLLVPTPAARRRVVATAREHGCTSVWFGAAAPLGLLAGALRRAGAQRLVASAQGHEAGWAVLPGARQMLRRVGNGVDAVTYLSEYFRERYEKALGLHPEYVKLSPGVDVEAFATSPERRVRLRAGYGLSDAPTVVCVSRLVKRKGQDALIRAWPAVRDRVPDARLLVVGGGPYRDELRRLVAETGSTDAVTLTGAVPHEDLAAHYGVGDVFAMPCRTRRGGLDIEGLGIVFLEASAAGLPVLAGDSGGAPEAVRDGETGLVVDGRDTAAIADRLAELLLAPSRSAAMGAAGREWVREHWGWQRRADTLRRLLDA